MLVLTAEQIRALASFPDLIDCLEQAFRKQHFAPPRQVIKVPGSNDDRLFLIMPAFEANGSGAVKLSAVYPDNQSKGLPTIQALIVVLSESGTPAAILDGSIITRMRTAAASALASKYLSRRDSSTLAIIGTGALAPMMAAAHCAVRPIEKIHVWGRRSERTAATIAEMQTLIPARTQVTTSSSVEEAVAGADVVSCSTSSTLPLVAGKWLRPGTFVDAVGSFSPGKREVDDDVVLRARIFVDTFEGALSEAGDILHPMRRGVIERTRIEGELADLVSGRVRARETSEEITFFKSVGTAIEDLAASRLVIAAAAANGLLK